MTAKEQAEWAMMRYIKEKFNNTAKIVEVGKKDFRLQVWGNHSTGIKKVEDHELHAESREEAIRKAYEYARISERELTTVEKYRENIAL